MDVQPRILIIEDDADINNVVSTYLKKQGFQCTQAFSGSEAQLLLRQTGSDAAYDLVITDLMLPGLTGQEIVAFIRSGGSVPIIVISAQDAPTDKIELFQLGVDDYLVKPFDLDELLARVLVQLRHATKAPQDLEHPSSETSFKKWVIDHEAHLLKVSDSAIKLTRTEFGIVEALVQRPKKVFSKRELYEAVWNEDCFIEEKAINVHISNIRSKLKSTETDHYIETVWGIGFKLCE